MQVDIVFTERYIKYTLFYILYDLGSSSLFKESFWIHSVSFLVNESRDTYNMELEWMEV